MALTPKHLKDICCINGDHLQCRYLDEEVDNQGNIINICKKMSPDKKIIDEEMIDFYNEIYKNGQDPTKQGVALGDNCQGYLPLKVIKQGYDVKS